MLEPDGSDKWAIPDGVAIAIRLQCLKSNFPSHDVYHLLKWVKIFCLFFQCNSPCERTVLKVQRTGEQSEKGKHQKGSHSRGGVA